MTNNQQPTPLELFDKGQDDDPVGNGWRGYSWTQNEVDIIRKALSSLGSQTDVDVKSLKRKVPKLPTNRLARVCELNAVNNAKIWNSCIDHLIERGLLKTGEAG